MPIPIIIAILVALFTLGRQMEQPKGGIAKEMSKGGKQIQPQGKKDSYNTLAVAANAPQSAEAEKEEATGTFDNIFQLSGLYQIIKAEPMNAIKNSINSNVSQAVGLAEKE